MWKWPSEILIGQAVTDVSLSDDGLLIELEGNWKLHVINPFSVSDGRFAIELVGETLIELGGESTFKRLTFSNGATLTVDLSGDKWSMTLSGPNSFFIWKGKAPVEMEASLRTAAAGSRPGTPTPASRTADYFPRARVRGRQQRS